jgi:hypothetical protein
MQAQCVPISKQDFPSLSRVKIPAAGEMKKFAE